MNQYAGSFSRTQVVTRN